MLTNERTFKIMEFNTYEYSAQQKPEGKFRVRMILFLALYFLFSATYFVVIYITRVLPLGAILPIFLWMLIFFTWRYVKPDYKYEIVTGTLTFTVRYGNKRKGKVATEFKVSSAHAIIPAADSEPTVKEFAPAKVYSALPSVSAADAYVALYTDKSGNKCAFYFVATEQALKLLRFYNSRTVVVKTTY